MLEIPRWRLTAGTNIPWIGGVTLRQPRLAEIFNDVDGPGFDIYMLYVNTIVADISDAITGSDAAPLPTFAILMLTEQFRSVVIDALSFYVVEDLQFNPDRLCIDVLRDDSVIGCIDASNFDQIRSGIMQINGIKQKKKEEPKFFNAAAERIYRQLEEQHKKAGPQGDHNINIPNIIEAISANSTSYNLTNIFQLTVWQLYNQFARLSKKVQTDIFGTRWAAWGEKEFDFSVWYEDVDKS